MTYTIEQPKRKKKGAIVTLLVLAVLGAGAIWWLEQGGGEGPAEPVLTPEAKAYTRNLELGDVNMKATDNVLGQMLLEIEGRITNAGDRPVSHVELTCLFYDPYGVEMWRERVAIVRADHGVLNPGETRKFRLPFDSIPDGWNQVMPRLIIAQILFG